MDNLTILKTFIQRIWNEKEFVAIPEFIAPEYTIQFDKGNNREGKTWDHTACKIRLQFSFNSFPDIYFYIQTAVADEDHVGITWIMTGTNLGSVATFLTAGKSIKKFGTTIYHFSNGNVCSIASFFNRITVMKQVDFIKE